MRPPVNKHDAPARKHLFEYPYKGHYYVFTLPAHSHEEAEERLAQLVYAKHLGQIEAEIMVPDAAAAPVGLFVRLVTWWKNTARHIRG